MLAVLFHYYAMTEDVQEWATVTVLSLQLPPMVLTSIAVSREFDE